MRLSIATLAVSLLATCASAADADPNFDRVNKPLKGEKIDAGSTYTIEWEVPEGAAKGPVTIALLAGPSDDKLQPVGIVAKSIDNSLEKYDWAVNATLGSAKVYGLTITLDTEPEHFQWSNPFHIVGKTGSGGSGTETSKTGDATTTTTKTAGSGETKTSTSTSTTGTGETSPTTGADTSAGPTGHDGTTSHMSTETLSPTNRTSSGPATQTQTGGAGATAGPLVAAGAYALAALLL